MATLISPSEAAALTNGAISSGKDFCRRVRRGDLPAGVYVRIGGRLFANRERFMAFLESGGAPPRAFAPQAAPGSTD
jgi:hypothetical protein